MPTHSSSLLLRTRVTPWRVSPLACALALSLTATGAHADPPVSPASPAARGRLAWVRAEGAESCPDATQLAARIAARLGQDPFATEGAPSVEAVVAREGTRWRARIFIRQHSGTLVGSREIASDEPDCGPLTDAVALAVALNIDAGRPAGTSSSSSSSSSSVTSTTLASDTSPASTTRSTSVHTAGSTSAGAGDAHSGGAATPPRARPRAPALFAAGSLRARAHVTYMVLAGWGPGAGLAGDVFVHRWFSVSASAMFLPETQTTLQSPAPARRYGFGLTSVGLDGCFTPVRTAWLAFGPCAGVQVGALYAVAFNRDPVEPGARPWFAATVGLRATARIAGPLVAELGADAVVPVTRYDFLTTAPENATIFLPWPVAPSGYLGLGVTIW